MGFIFDFDPEDKTRFGLRKMLDKANISSFHEQDGFFESQVDKGEHKLVCIKDLLQKH